MYKIYFRKTKLFLKITLFVLISFFIINFISGYFSERVRVYVKQKTILEASSIISKTIKSQVLPNIDMDNLVKTTTNNETEKIESIFINTYQVNKIMADTTDEIQNVINNLNNEDLNRLKLPFGVIISDTLFNDVGPNVSIVMYPIGSVECDVITKYENYGINNTILTIDIKVSVSFTTMIPLRKDEVTVITNIPIVVQVIQGEVPRYYYYNTDSQFIPHPINLD